MNVFDPPRWPDGPRICTVANLPSFADDQSVSDFRDKNCPSHTIIAKWRCKVCRGIHFWSVGGDPSGASSGTTRIGKHADEIKEKFLASETAKTAKEWL